MWKKKITDPEAVLPVRDEKTDSIYRRFCEYTDDGRSEDEFFMDAALELAGMAAECGEVPVGCVIVREGRIVSLAANGREVYRDATCHAETSAISAAGRELGGWRLPGCTLYVTMEPCPMCAGAIWAARIPRVVIGIHDPKAGGMGGLFDIFSQPLNHRPDVTFGVREEECVSLLRSFFDIKRKQDQ